MVQIIDVCPKALGCYCKNRVHLNSKGSHVFATRLAEKISNCSWCARKMWICLNDVTYFLEKSVFWETEINRSPGDGHCFLYSNTLSCFSKWDHYDSNFFSGYDSVSLAFFHRYDHGYAHNFSLEYSKINYKVAVKDIYMTIDYL